MEIRKVRKKSPVFEAVLVTEENIREVAEWCGGVVEEIYSSILHKTMPRISNPPRNLGEFVHINDWVLRDTSSGEFYAWSRSMFVKNFERTEEI